MCIVLSPLKNVYQNGLLNSLNRHDIHNEENVKRHVELFFISKKRNLNRDRENRIENRKEKKGKHIRKLDQRKQY